MIDRNTIRQIGQLQKPHGVNGEMALSLSSSVVFKSYPMYLICMMDGILVPFFVESFREKSANVLLVKFEDVNSIEDTRRFQSVTAFVPNDCLSDELPDELSWNMFIDYQIIDKKAGSLGTIVAVDDSTLNILFLVRDGERERVIPANDVWMEKIDAKAGKIYYNLPDGVADL